MPVRSLAALAAFLALAACNAPLPEDTNVATNEPAANAAAPSPTDVPLSDRPAPEPLTSGKPLAGEWDPDLMTVTLAGDNLEIQDAKHSWPLTLEQSTYGFARQGMASFGTPVLSHSIAECPAGKLDYLDYANGLQLAFQEGKLVGYWVKEGSRGVFVGDRIAPGSPRTVLGNARVEEASFGKLVTIDGTTAVLDDKETKITDLYAGLACIFD